MPRKLKTQTPGEIPGVDRTQLEVFLAGNVADIVIGLPDLTNAELDALLVLEQTDSARHGVLEAIVAEQRVRAEGTAPLMPEFTGAGLGDAHTFKDKHSSQINLAQLERPVLCLDGWVLPPPQAHPE